MDPRSPPHRGAKATTATLALAPQQGLLLAPRAARIRPLKLTQRVYPDQDRPPAPLRLPLREWKPWLDSLRPNLESFEKKWLLRSTKRLATRPEERDLDLKTASEAQADRSREFRGLLEGLDKNELLRLHPAPTSPATEGEPTVKDIEANMDHYLRREEAHRASLPRPGDGAHYVRGNPPFWRQPWPSNWKVPKPWEFAKLYDQAEMQSQLKTSRSNRI